MHIEVRIRTEQFIIMGSNNNNNHGICEAVNCFAYATTNLFLHVGNKGRISINICNDCAKNRFGYIIKEEL